MGEYKLIVLDNPYEHLDNNHARDIFNKIIDLKKRCYSKYYGKFYAPVDKWDFHGTHMSLCELRGGSYHPVVSLRTVTNIVCNNYGFRFNGYNLLSSCENIEHKNMLNMYIDKSIDSGKTISTTSGLAFDPDFKDKRFLIEMFYPLFTYSYINGNWDCGVIIGACASGLNNRYANKLGYKYLYSNNEKLPSVSVPSCGGQQFDVMTIDDLALDAIDYGIKNISLWHDRISFSESNDSVDNYFKEVALKVA